MKKIKINSIKTLNINAFDIPDINAETIKSQSFLSQMAEESNSWLEYSNAYESMFNKTYIQNMIDAGAKIVSGTTCSAVSRSISNGEISYTRDVRVGRTNYGNNVYKTDRTGTTHQGVISGPGRMGGLGGWSKDGNLIAAALVSFAHNFVITMLAFFERAKLPLDKKITLPNMVLAETKTPSQFVPPLSMTYSLPPTPIMISTIKINAPVKSSFFIVQRNMSRQEFAKTDVIEIEQGTTELSIITQLNVFENEGIFDIEPYNAPKGLVIESIQTIPPAIRPLQ